MRRLTRRRFTAIELVIAMGVLMVVLAILAVNFKTLHRAHGVFTQENRCLMVLSNTVERLRVMDNPDQAAAQSVLAEEFAAMEMPYKGNLEAVAEWKSGAVELHIRETSGKPVTGVRFKAP